MKAKPSSSTNRMVRWPLIVFCWVFVLGWIGIPDRYQTWVARKKYDERYSKLLNLPESVSRPKGYLARMPGVVGRALMVDFYQPDLDKDAGLRSWMVDHEGFSEFKSEHMAGYWEASRGGQFLIVSRDDASGWVHITLGQKMSPEEADKDLKNFPWKEAMAENGRRREEP